MDIVNRPLIMAKLFENPKCKPWDLVKGRRLRCCHGLVTEGHRRHCFQGMRGMTMRIPKIGRLSISIGE